MFITKTVVDLSIMINHFQRYQVGLTLNDLYPKIEGTCACGCDMQLIKPQKKWYSEDCCTKAYINFAIIKGNNFIIREQLFLRDAGVCQHCGDTTNDWQADHILPVYMGGGGKSLDNFQTLCDYCHKQKSYNVDHLKAISSHAASILVILDLNAVGA